MAYNDFVTNIANADTDAQALSAFMQQPASAVIPRRIAGSIKPLDYYLGFLHGLELVYSQQSGEVDVNGVKVKTVTQAIKDAINAAGVANGVNANLVSYLAQIAGAVGRTQSDKNIERVSVKDFGVKGNGVTDDTVAFQKAIDYMMTNGVGLKIPKSSGKYIINGSVTNTSGGVIDIVADVGAEIDGTNSTAALLFLLGGNISTTNYQLTADSAKGSVNIVAPGHDFVAGDIIRILSTDLWNPTRVYYY